MPNELTTSAFPSPVVSRSRRIPPRCPETATSRSPFSRTTMWREGPIDSATSSAQNPGGSVSPALSGAQMGFRTCDAGSSSNAIVEKRSVRVMRKEYTFPAHTLTFRSPSPDGRGGQGVRMSLHALLLVVQAATSPPQSTRLAALKDEVVRDVAARAQFTQQMVDQIFSFAELGF